MSPSTRPPRVLLLYTTTGYQAEDFLKAARRLEIETLIGTDRCHVLEDPWADGAIPLRFEDPEAAVRSIIEAAEQTPLDAIVPIGDRPTWVAALAAQALGLVHNPPGAVASSRNKLRSRRAFQAAGLRAPAFSSHPITVDPRKAGLGAPYPCVLKPLALGASRGVIRANDPEEFEAAFRRVAALLRAEVNRVAPELGRYLQPKCGELRTGYCDESEEDWEACPIGRVRPHKAALFRLYDQYRRGELQPLRDEDWDTIEGIGAEAIADG